MTEITVAAASKCPECDQTGSKDISIPIIGGTRHKLTCKNEVCPWYDTSWYIETDANGLVQVNEEAYEKANTERIIQAKSDPMFEKYFQQVHAQLGAQLNEETNKQ